MQTFSFQIRKNIAIPEARRGLHFQEYKVSFKIYIFKNNLHHHLEEGFSFKTIFLFVSNYQNGIEGY